MWIKHEEDKEKFYKYILKFYYKEIIPVFQVPEHYKYRR